MNISYSRPLELGWSRMKQALFQPFDLGHWFVLGFTAWLAQLGESSGGLGNNGYRVERHLDQEGLREGCVNAWHWFADFISTPLGIVLTAFVILGLILLSLLLIWLSSRGRFMFLDNLIKARTEVTHPWREFRDQGDSLFLWRLGYAVVALFFSVVVFGGFVAVLVPALGLPAYIRLMGAIGLGMVGFVFLTTVIFIDYFLDYFVVPIMYLRRVGATEAWGIFLKLFQTRPGAFVLFGLLYLAILMVMGIAYLLGGLLTCCVGLLLLAIPYIGTVLMLPIQVLGQFMNLEFLAQFGDDFNLLAPITEPGPGPNGSGQFDADRTVVRAVDISEDPSTDETRPQDS